MEGVRIKKGSKGMLLLLLSLLPPSCTTPLGSPLMMMMRLEAPTKIGGIGGR